MRKLSLRELEEMEYILLEEIEQQCWYSIAFVGSVGDEILITIQ